MNVNEYVNEMRKACIGSENTSDGNDRIIIGDAECDVTKAAFSMFATPEVIRKAMKWGANLLVVHEPTFYDNSDRITDTPVSQMKQKLINESGLTIYRIHDRLHNSAPDIICRGELEHLAIPGEFQKGKFFAINRYVLNDELTAAELAHVVEEKLNIRHVRIAGCIDKKGKNISCCFGSPGHIAEELEENDFVLVGETCEWACSQIAKDYDELGYNKAILVLGHTGSERDGMELLSRLVKSRVTEVETMYFDCGEVYKYIS